MTKKSLIVVTALILILVPFMIKNDYLIHLLISVCIYSILGMGFSLIWKCRLITVGAAGFWAIGAYTSALLVTKMGLSFWIAMPVAGLTSALFGFVVFSIALRGGPLLFFSMSLIFTFIVMEVLGTVEFFGGWEGLLDIPPPSIGPFVFFSKTSFYYLGLFLLFLNITIYHALYKSRIGRAWTAIGSSVRLAQAQGINVYRYRLAATVISCFFTGLIGSFFAHYQSLLVPSTFSFVCSVNIQMYALIGGLSYFIAGPIVGAAVMIFLPELLRPIQEFQPILFGILIIMIVIFIPGGILSIPKRFPLINYVRIGIKNKLKFYQQIKNN